MIVRIGINIQLALNNNINSYNLKIIMLRRSLLMKLNQNIVVNLMNNVNNVIFINIFIEYFFYLEFLCEEDLEIQ